MFYFKISFRSAIFQHLIQIYDLPCFVMNTLSKKKEFMQHNLLIKRLLFKESILND